MLSARYARWMRPTRPALVLALLVGLLLVARARPPNGFGLWLRLLAATSLVLLPAVVVAWKFALPLISGAVSVSLTLLTVALAATFLSRSSLNVALLVYALAAFALTSLVRPAAAAAGGWREEGLGGIVALGFGGLLWPIAGALTGDALFHLARVRKLESFGSLSLSRVVEFRNGGLHPGYAFPLWHGFLAFVARLGNVDPRQVVLHESSVLTAVALLVAYEAGRALFQSKGLGVAAALGQLALVALAPGHGGGYISLALPATAARQILVPATIALALTLDATGQRYSAKRQLPLLLATSAAGLALAFTHITYALFLAVVFAGFLLLRLLSDHQDARRLAIPVAFYGTATAAVVAWLVPLASNTRSHDPTCAEISRAFSNYQEQLVHSSCTNYSLAPAVFTRSGSIAFAALLFLPVAALTVRQRGGSFLLGGTLAILACTLPAATFPHFADLVSISQARRAAGFILFPLVVTAVASVAAAGLRRWSLVLALGLGITLQVFAPGSFGASLPRGLPGFPVWVALIGGAVATAWTLATRVRLGRPPARMALAAVALFVTPTVVHGFLHWTAGQPRDRNALTAGATRAISRPALRGGVIFSGPATSYEIAADAPVYIADAPVAHVANTVANDPYVRRRDALRFLATGDLAIPRRYGACTILLRRHRHLQLRLPTLYRDPSFVLYALPPVWRSGRCRG